VNQPSEPSARPLRFAAIDVGTNSIREIVVEASRDGSLRLIDDEKIAARLGDGVGEDGNLSPPAMARAIQGIRRLREIADAHRVHHLEAVATAAVRSAPNRDAFLERARRETGLSIRVISSEEEARLAFKSLCHNFELGRGRVLGLDVGGGSLDLVLANGRLIEAVYSIPTGALLLSERLGCSGPQSRKDLRRVRRAIRRIVERALPEGIGADAALYASGGTIASLATIAQARRGESYASIHGCVVTRSEVKAILREVAALGPKERRSVPGLPGDRIDIIVAGLALVLEVLRRAGASRLCASEKGIREGLVLEMVRRAHPRRRPPARSRLEGVKRLTRICDPDRRHTVHVTRLALSLHDQIFGPSPRRDGEARTERELLEAAALLHNIGRFIGYRKHHKHAYHMIVHSDLVGYSPREIELIANVARYHRRAEPKRKHANFAMLDREAQATVRRLAALLKLAGGLDRSHRRRVESVKVRRRKGRLVIIARASDENVDLEVWGARRNLRLLEKVLGTSVTLAVRRAPASGASVARPRAARRRDRAAERRAPSGAAPVPA